MGCLAAGPDVRSKVLLSEQFVHRASPDSRKKLTLGIGPGVGVAGLQQQWTRSDQSYQHVRIHRRSIGKATVLSRSLRRIDTGSATARSDARSVSP